MIWKKLFAAVLTILFCTVPFIIMAQETEEVVTVVPGPPPTAEEKANAAFAAEVKEKTKSVEQDLKFYAFDLAEQSNYAEARALAKKGLESLSAGYAGGEAGLYWYNYVNALLCLNAESEYDEMLEYTAKKFPDNLYFLASLPWTMPTHYGYIFDNKFKRGNNRGNAGRYVNSYERDRVRMLQLMTAALPEVEKSASKKLKQEFYSNLAQLLQWSGQQSWKLQTLTNLSKLPDYDDSSISSCSRPPVNPDGTPVYYSDPGSWEAAKNDGERMRRAYERAIDAGSKDAQRLLAEWLSRQFDFFSVDYYVRMEYLSRDAYLQYLYNLKDNETVAQLADGIRKITLPEDQNYIRMYMEAEAYNSVAGVMTSRAQFERAVEYYKKAGNKEQAEKITAENGMAEQFRVLTPAETPRLEYTYRNAKTAQVVIRKVDAQKAVEKMLQCRKEGKDSYFYNAYQLVDEAETENNDWRKFIGKTVADYQIKLSPKPHHWDNTEYIDLPLKEPGAYLVRITPGTAKNNWVEVLVWIAPEVLTDQGRYGIDQQQFILSKPDGTPSAGKKVRLEKYKTLYAQNPQQVKEYGGRTKIVHETQEFTTGADGAFLIRNKDFEVEGSSSQTNYLMLVQDPELLTWFPVNLRYNYMSGSDRGYPRGFVITDRPIYKPGDTVKFTVYPRIPKYGSPVQMRYRKKLGMNVYNPRHEEVWKGQVELVENTGAYTGEFTLPADAAPGSWRLEGGYGNNWFRVEEYKKPEYELSVTIPGKPVKLGEKIPITIQAKYYFGAPMAEAKVTYKVFREEAAQVWPFFGRFDWLYGPGYLICSTAKRAKTEQHRMYGREMVLDGSGQLDAEGKLEFTVDSADALARFGAHDYRYIVEAEVADSSNRVIAGSGSVLAAAKPFYVWLNTDCGYAVTGKSFKVHTKALTGDGREVTGKGIMKIYRRALNRDGVPERTGEPVKTVEFIPGAYNAPGFVMDIPGVYELEATVTTADGITESGSALLYVQGKELSGNLFSTEDFEITLDKGEYQPGDTVRALVTTKKPGRTVYFYRRPERKLDYECVKIDGHSRVFEMKLDAEDQPNTFIRLYAVSGGKACVLSKEIPVPPERKMLNVKADIPEKSKPGVSVPLKIKVTGLDGKPVKGAVTVAVYDKSLEALASSNIFPVNSFFWNWRRHFYSDSPSSNIHSVTSRIYPEGYHWESMAYLMGAVNYRLGKSYYIHRYRESKNEHRRSRGGESEPAVYACAMTDTADTLGGERRSVAAQKAKEANAPVGRSINNKPMAPIRYNMDGGSGNGSDSVAVRSDFRDTAFWLGVKEVADDGTLTLDVPMPDNLTTWKIRVWSITNDVRVGEGSAEIIVSKDLIARLELPRFMIQQDTVQAIANVHNYTEKTLTVNLSLSVNDENVISAENLTRTVTVQPQKHSTETFMLTAKNAGEAKLVLKAVSADGKDSDALELKLPVLVKGMDKQVNACGRLDAEKRTAAVTLTVPEQRRPENTFLTLNLSPGAAKTMVELLPYLADDDSRDVFGVVSRFVPALSAEAALKKMGVNFADLKLSPGSRDKLYSEYMQLYVFGPQNFSGTVATFDPAVFKRVTGDSLKMILSMVNSDGGWGWFSGYRERSYPDTTAFVLDALLTAKSNGAHAPQNILKRGTNWLYAYAEKRYQEMLDKVYVSNTDALVASVLKRAGKPHAKYADLIYERRQQLSPYGLAMLAFAYDKGTEKRVMLKRNLTQFLKQDNENGTAYLEIPDSMWFFWWGNENVTQAAYLRLLIADDPKDPVAVKLANYLVTNIRNSPWRNSTRTLGNVVQALAEYIVTTGENQIDLTATVKLDGKVLKTLKINSKNMWQSEFTAAAGPDLLTSGKHKLEIEMQGQGVLYFNSMLNYFTLEDRIGPAGLEMKIRRNYYKLVPDKDATARAAGTKGSALTIKVDKYKRVPVKDGDTFQPGDIIEVELISTAKNDYDYVVFADSMPAGFEYVKPVSGYVWNWRAPVYCEYRERGARFYLRNMARGESNVFYQIRAQLPGTFTSLPASGKGVYAPELKCNSSQMKLIIK